MGLDGYTVVSVLVREQKRLMAWLTLLFHCYPYYRKVTSLHCSDQQLPARSPPKSHYPTILPG